VAKVELFSRLRFRGSDVGEVNAAGVNQPTHRSLDVSCSGRCPARVGTSARAGFAGV